MKRLLYILGIACLISCGNKSRMTDEQYREHLDSLAWKHYSEIPTFYMELRSNTHLVYSKYNCKNIKDGAIVVLVIENKYGRVKRLTQ